MRSRFKVFHFVKNWTKNLFIKKLIFQKQTLRHNPCKTVGTLRDSPLCEQLCIFVCASDKQTLSNRNLDFFGLTNSLKISVAPLLTLLMMLLCC